MPKYTDDISGNVHTHIHEFNPTTQELNIVMYTNIIYGPITNEFMAK